MKGTLFLLTIAITAAFSCGRTITANSLAKHHEKDIEDSLQERANIESKKDEKILDESIEEFDTSKCPECGVAEHYEMNDKGQRVSCKCMRNINNQFGGDMRLTETTRAWINQLYGRGQRAITNSLRFHWPLDSTSGNVNVPFVIDANIPAGRRETISAAMEEYKRNTCIRFKERSVENDYLNITDAGGCWSYVGRQGGRQELSLSGNCNKIGVVEHELMHSLGFFHEQSRPDRDDYVSIQYQNIVRDFQSNFDKMLASEVDLGETPYDLGSVMHYGEYAFSINGRKTILVLNNPEGVRVGQREGFSEYDLIEINRKYCSGQSTTTEQSTTTPITTTTEETTAPSTTTPSNGCKNEERDRHCNYWASLGFCNHRFEAYMRARCKLACGFCD